MYRPRRMFKNCGTPQWNDSTIPRRRSSTCNYIPSSRRYSNCGTPQWNDSPIPRRRSSTYNSTSGIKVSPDQVKRVHLEYLRIMQKYYSKQYVILKDRIVARYGEGILQSSGFKKAESSLFQGSGYFRLSKILQQRDLNEYELYIYTDEYQHGMKDALRTLKSIL